MEHATPKKEANHAAKITGYEDVPANNEAALMKAVARQPVAVVMLGDLSFRSIQVAFLQDLVALN